MISYVLLKVHEVFIKVVRTFLGQIAAPKSGKTVAPPASTSLICHEERLLTSAFQALQHGMSSVFYNFVVEEKNNDYIIQNMGVILKTWIQILPKIKVN